MPIENESPLVSVIIPTFRMERFVGRAIRSALAQTHRAIEVLVIDDGSDDGSGDVARAIADDRLRVISQANAGVAAARNHGIAESRGPLLAFLDADDLWAPTKLERHVAFLAAHPDVDLAYGYSVMIDENDQPRGPWRAQKIPEITPLSILLRDPIGNGSNVVVRREALLRVGVPGGGAGGRTMIFNEDPAVSTAEDSECWFRLAVAGVRFGCVGEALTSYRMLDETAAAAERKLAAHVRLIERAEELLPGAFAPERSRILAYRAIALARRQAMHGDPGEARRLMTRALADYPRLALEEAGDTAATVVAVAIANLPRPVARPLLAAGARARGAVQRLRLTARSN